MWSVVRSEQVSMLFDITESQEAKSEALSIYSYLPCQLYFPAWYSMYYLLRAYLQNKLFFPTLHSQDIMWGRQTLFDVTFFDHFNPPTSDYNFSFLFFFSADSADKFLFSL